MSKMYVKDPDGKYRLVDKETQTGTKKVETNNKTLTLEALDARLKRVEAMFAGPQK
jgi:hypothetical protein